MATLLDRYNAVLDALTDPVILSAGQRTAVGDAYLAQASDAQILALIPGAPMTGNAVNRAALTNAQRAAIVLARWHYEAKIVVKQVRRDQDQAAADALMAAGQAEADEVL